MTEQGAPTGPPTTSGNERERSRPDGSATTEGSEAPEGTASSDNGAADTAEAAQPPALAEGQHVGPYRIVREIARSGGGVTYEAAVTETVTRRVAVKVALDGDAQAVLRGFVSERHARAAMEQPGLASILASGLTDKGRPYLVTELPGGVPLVEYCDRRALTTRERIDLLLGLCATVAHARSSGALRLRVDHSSVLVTELAGRPLVRVEATDTPLARAADTTWALRPSLPVSVEDVSAPAADSLTVGRRAVAAQRDDDVQALGTLLLELLVGTATATTGTDAGDADDPPPTAAFRAPSETLLRSSPTLADEVALRHRTDRSHLLAELRRDLDFIVRAALDPLAVRRYRSLRAFSEDLHRYVAREPISLRRDSLRYRFARSVSRRHARLARAASLLQGVIAMALTGQPER